VEAGETDRHALEREIQEELNLTIVAGAQIMSATLGDIELVLYDCLISHGTMSLTEHADLKWLERSKLRLLDWAPADIPLLEPVSLHLGQRLN
jgi:8-oxo-dGTP diphosphatase